MHLFKNKQNCKCHYVFDLYSKNNHSLSISFFLLLRKMYLKRLISYDFMNYRIRLDV